MKNFKSSIISSFMTLIFCLPVFSQESIEKISESYAIPKADNYSEVHIQNLYGSITVESYDGKTLLLEATKTITAKNEDELEKGNSQIELGVYEYEKGLFIYLDHPCAIFDTEKLRLNYNCNDHRGFNKRDYKFNMDITVKIPKDINFVDASTINNGEIYIQGLNCDMNVSNVNGPVTVDDHAGNIEASTVNGNLTINFIKDPKSYAKFHTINGIIKVLCSKNLSAKVKYKSMNGDFFTDFDNIIFLPAELKKAQSKHINATKYKISDIKSFSIGGGETMFSFKTLNGNIFLTSK